MVDSNPSVVKPRNSQVKRKKVFLYSNEFPSELKEYIHDVLDVLADGNCGFRVIPAELGLGQDNWNMIRMQLYQEMIECQQLYSDVFGVDRVQLLRESTTQSQGPNQCRSG
jgi:hypothetical protein